MEATATVNKIGDLVEINDKTQKLSKKSNKTALKNRTI